MPRPPRCRRICDVPQVDKFCPNGCEDVEPILLTLDEYEVIRLVDLEQISTRISGTVEMVSSVLPHRQRYPRPGMITNLPPKTFCTFFLQFAGRCGKLFQYGSANAS